MSQPGPRWGEFEPQPSSSSPAPSYSPLLSLPTFPGAGGGRPCFRVFSGAGPGALPPPGGGDAGPRSRPGAPRRLPGGAACSGVPAAGRRFFGTGPRSDGGGGLGRSLQPPCSQPSYPFLQFERMPWGFGLMAHFEQLATCCLGKEPPRGFLGRN